MILGVSGKACSGKNAVADFLEEKGFKSVDMDLLAHKALKEKSLKVAEQFGNDILDDNGNINRPSLGKIVFRNKKKLKELERIIHPAVFFMVRQIISEKKGENLILNTGLLGRTGMDLLCDMVLWVEAPFMLRIKRARTRDKKKLSYIISRIYSQLDLTVQHFSPGVDIYMVRNFGSLDCLKKQINDFLKTPENYKRV